MLNKILQNFFSPVLTPADEAFSGTETTKRLSFQRLLQDGKSKKYDVLLAKSYSRFGRNQRETLTALAELFENGVRIIFVEDGLDSQRDKGQFGLFAWLAEQESRKISERIKMTWELYNKEGKIHNVKPPYGYEFNSAIRNFVVIEEEAKTVELIFDMYLQGNGCQKIANFLINNNYPTKRGGIWRAKTVENMVRSEFYVGHLIQGKRRTIDVTIKKSEHIDRKNWHIHKNNHEPIITEEIFHKAQEEYKKRSEYLKQYLPSHHSTIHLFSNLVKCKICGSACIARKSRVKSKERCYSCGTYEEGGVSRCGHKRNAINQRDLLVNIQSALEMLAEDDFKVVKSYYKQNNAHKRRERGKLGIDTLDKQIEEQTKLGNSLLGLFSEGIIGKEQFKLQNDVIAEKINLLMKQREEVLLEQNKLKVDIDEQGETIKSVRNLLDTDISDWTNEMMKKVINRINLDMGNDEVEIVYNFSISSK